MFKLALMVVCGLLLATPQQALRWVGKALTEAHSFTASVEGPAVDRNGNLFACNFKQNGTIGKVTPQGTATVFVKLPAGGRSAGLRFDSAGFLLALDYINHLVYRVDPSTGEFLEVLTKDWKGLAFRQPNDLEVAPDGSIYFTDPDWSSSYGGRVFAITPGSERHTVLMAENLNTPNGITVSPDNRRVYVGQSRGHNILVFDREPDGQLKNQRIFFATSTLSETALPDGMRCDKDGNLYVAMVGLGQILVITPDGKLKQTIRTIGSKPSNLAFNAAGNEMLVTEVEYCRIERFRRQ